MTWLKSGLWAALFAGAMCGQDVTPPMPAQPAPAQNGTRFFSGDAVQRAFKQLAETNALKGSTVRLGPLANSGQFRQLPGLLAYGPQVCAARLLEAPLPEETAFGMPVLRVDGNTESMPEANLPAPACPKQKP
jgi:hypothetical protein